MIIVNVLFSAPHCHADEGGIYTQIMLRNIRHKSLPSYVMPTKEASMPKSCYETYGIDPSFLGMTGNGPSRIPRPPGQIHP